ncbi:hypothetical protein [Paraflavitalea speifideaquila]|uniref:hypothetical protein n=1 Tax=Paraflavitalea speifideaquila TaxID=3076558 RepID=UPI003CCCD1ED
MLHSVAAIAFIDQYSWHHRCPSVPWVAERRGGVPKACGRCLLSGLFRFYGSLIVWCGINHFQCRIKQLRHLIYLEYLQATGHKKKWESGELHYLRAAKRFEFIICVAAMFIAPFIMFAKGGLYTYLQK